jgi:hypothetical protein
MRGFSLLVIGLILSTVWVARSTADDWVTLAPLPSEPPLRIGQQKQLLVDRELLADWGKVRWIQEKVKKHPSNPLIGPDQPWEKTLGYGMYPTSAIYDPADGLFKLWYTIERVVGYVTSKDGIRWTKPDLGLVEYAGTRHNNVCRVENLDRPYSGCIHLIQGPRPDAGEIRYIAIGANPYHSDGTTYGGWLGIATSSDGVNWRQIQGGLRGGSGGGNPSCLWDERLQRFVLFHRQLTERALTQGAKRYIVRQESQDLKAWSPRQTVFNPTDSRWPEVESMMVFRHEGLLFGFPQVLDSEIRGEVEIHLATSRDGFRWEHPFPNEAFIPRGPRGDFDDMITWFAQTVVTADDMRFYYGGARYPHSKPVSPIVEDGGGVTFTTTTGVGRVDNRINQIGLATVPLDRLIGIRADEPVGAFLTRPLLVEGDDLFLNANVDRELRVEVVDPVAQVADSGPKGGVMGHYITGQERVFPGFARQDCEAVTGDGLSHRIRWKGGSIGQFKGQAVRLRILARMATIYAFQIK